MFICLRHIVYDLYDIHSIVILLLSWFIHMISKNSSLENFCLFGRMGVLATTQFEMKGNGKTYNLMVK